MDFVAEIPVFGGFLSTMVYFIIVLGVVVFIHEYGHYIVGRWCGIKADVFSMGMGPVIWSREDKRGTKWQVAAIPIGGYVKFLGDRNAASGSDDEAVAEMSAEDQAQTFTKASVLSRALTVLAGPMFNFMLSIALFAGLIMWQGVGKTVPTVGELLELPYEGQELQIGDEILAINGQEVTSFGEIYSIAAEMEQAGDVTLRVRRNGEEMTVSSPYLLPPAVYSADPLTPASEAGLQQGDVILEADGVALITFGDLRDIIENSNEAEVMLTVWRGGEILELPIQPKKREYPDGQGGFEERVMIGVSGSGVILPAMETPGPIQALKLGVTRVGDVIDMSLNGLKHIILGNLSPKNLQGPVGIAQMSKATANHGVITFLSFIAVVSVGIGMLNLFPIPMLDGGHLIFYLIEAVRGQPLGAKTINIAISIGLAMVLLLMVFVTYNDLLRL